MSRSSCLAVALTIVVSLTAVPVAVAACAAPFLITSINSNEGSYAYVYNPSVTVGYGGGGWEGSSFTLAFTGFFWGLGVGDPAPGVGADSGTFDALNFFYPYPNYPIFLLTYWSASTEIDSCIDVMGPLGDRCQVTFLQDVDIADGTGLFALVVTPDDPASGDFFLDNDGVNLILAPMPGAFVLDLDPYTDDSQVVVRIQGPRLEDIEPGLYVEASGGCDGVTLSGEPGSLVQGFRLFHRVQPRHASPPTDFLAVNWVDAGLGVVEIGGVAEWTVDCSDGDSDVYVAWQLVMDGGFSSPILSGLTTRIECGPNYADPDNNRERPPGRQAPTGRQGKPRTR